jgi:fructose-1,6-bisphosphatase II
VKLIGDGDVAGAIATGLARRRGRRAVRHRRHPEGVIAAAALKGMGGEIQGLLWPRNDAERDAAIAAGYDLDEVLSPTSW